MTEPSRRRPAVLLKACLNGTRTKGDHPAVPITPEELSTDAVAVVAAGAGAVHIHPRGADGAESLEPDAVGSAVAAVKAAIPDVPVGVTTAAWIEPDLERRLGLIDAWEVLPDFASVNMSEAGAPEVCARLRARGIGVEAGLFQVTDVEALGSGGVADRCLRALVEPIEPDPEAAVRIAADIDAALDRAAADLPRLHHGFGVATWAVIRAALERGRDVRVGLEDTLVLEDGSPAIDNAQLVSAAHALVGGVER